MQMVKRIVPAPRQPAGNQIGIGERILLTGRGGHLTDDSYSTASDAGKTISESHLKAATIKLDDWFTDGTFISPPWLTTATITFARKRDRDSGLSKFRKLMNGTRRLKDSASSSKMQRRWTFTSPPQAVPGVYEPEPFTFTLDDDNSIIEILRVPQSLGGKEGIATSVLFGRTKAWDSIPTLTAFDLVQAVGVRMRVQRQLPGSNEYTDAHALPHEEGADQIIVPLECTLWGIPIGGDTRSDSLLELSFSDLTM